MICGTRASALALAQTQAVLDAISELYPDIVPKRAVMRTSGDRFAGERMRELGEPGVFVNDIDSLLLSGKIDFAVHSLKDIPTVLSKGLEISAVLPRGDPRDFLVSELPLGSLPPGSRVGTSSPRRRAQVLRARPDLNVVPLRGNVPTRLSKVSSGSLDAAVVAKAGLDRLRARARGFALTLVDFVPAPAQGTIAVVSRSSSESARRLRALDHRPTRIAVDFERQVMRSLGGGCAAPVGVYARCIAGRVSARAMVLSRDGNRAVRLDSSFAISRIEDGKRRFVEQLAGMGGKELVKEAAAEANHR
jgi:hydroxymethylbilane synthase